MKLTAFSKHAVSLTIDRAVNMVLMLSVVFYLFLSSRKDYYKVTISYEIWKLRFHEPFV